jgi:hypothetical protein
MRRSLSVLIVVGVLSIAGAINGYGQNMASVIKIRAMDMARALARQDFEKYTTFMYPTLTSEAKKQMKNNSAMLDSAKKQFAAFKPMVKKILIGHPEKIVTYNKVMQTMLTQEMEITTTLFSISYTTMLIALSNDNGKQWYFADANFYRTPEAKKMLPELSPELTLPASQPPTITPIKKGQ